MTYKQIDAIKYALLYDAEQYPEIGEEVYKFCKKRLTRANLTENDLEECDLDYLTQFWLKLIRKNSTVYALAYHRWKVYVKQFDINEETFNLQLNTIQPPVSTIEPLHAQSTQSVSVTSLSATTSVINTPISSVEAFEPSNVPESKSPSIFQMAKNLTTAVVKDVVAGRPRRTQEETNKILDICKSCPDFLEDSKRCRLCGCFLPIKATWAKEKCPVNKW